MADVPASPRGGPGGLFLDPLIGDLCEAIADDAWQRQFEAFFRRHCDKFSPDPGAEHALGCTDIYGEFQGLFDRQLEAFTEARGLSPAAFVSRVRAAQDRAAHARKYLDILLASTEYAAFAELMRRMRELEERAGRARVYAVRDRQDNAEEKGRGARASDDEKPSAKRGDDWVEMDKYTPDDDRGDAK